MRTLYTIHITCLIWLFAFTSLLAQSNWNQLIVRDAVGHSQTLYFGPPDTIDLHQYELPPPIAGTFDVRFDSNRAVFLGDAINSKWTRIRISNAIDPINISWIVVDTSVVNYYLNSAVDSVSHRMLGSDSLQTISSGNFNFLEISPKPIIIPSEFKLGPAVPNPFDSSGVSIAYQSPLNCLIQLWIEDVAGTLKIMLDSSQHSAGYTNLFWNARNQDSVLVPYGIYFCKLWATAGYTTLFRDSIYIYYQCPTFSIPFVSDAHGLISFGLNFGVHPKATKGIDQALGEQEYPPFPPGGGITMFTSISGNSILDLRPYTNPSQVDTYKVGFTVDEEAYPITFTWPDVNTFYSGSVQLKGSLNDTPVNIDMKVEHTFTVSSGPAYGVVYFNILTQGPLPVDSIPVISTYGVGDIGFQAIVNASSGTLLKSTNVSGENTEVWFEYGPTKSYGTSTTHQFVPAGSSMNISEPFDPSTLPLNTRIHFRAVAHNSLGVFYGDDRAVSNGNPPPESVDPTIIGLPTKTELQQNYPNPFNPSTTISYQLPTQSHVTLKVFDLLGREVAALVNRVEEPGYKSVNFDASGLSSGMYYYRLVVKAIPSGQAGNFVETKKLVLLK